MQEVLKENSCIFWLIYVSRFDILIITGKNRQADMLGCTRHNIEKLIEKGKLHPVKRLPQSTLLLKSEVEQRKAGA